MLWVTTHRQGLMEIPLFLQTFSLLKCFTASFRLWYSARAMRPSQMRGRVQLSALKGLYNQAAASEEECSLTSKLR